MSTRKPDLNRDLLDIMLGIACGLVALGVAAGAIGDVLLRRHAERKKYRFR